MKGLSLSWSWRYGHRIIILRIGVFTNLQALNQLFHPHDMEH